MKYILFSLYCITLLGSEKQYFGPHVTATEPWVNEIIVFNNGLQTERFQLTIWNDQGQISFENTYDVLAMGSIEFVMASSGKMDEDKIILDPVHGSFIISASSETIVPLLSFQFGDSQSISQFFLSDTLAEQYVLPGNGTEYFSWSGVAVMNPYDQELSITLNAINDGETVGYAQKKIPARSKFVGQSSTLWPDLGLEEFGQIVISADEAFPAPILISGNSAQDRHLFFSAMPIGKPSLTEQYNLFSPLNSTTTFLLDNQKTVLHTWESEYTPGNSVYLQQDGSILRTGNIRNTRFTAGGAGGVIQHIQWDGQITWDYTFSSDQYLQHHDIAKLPNGNILMIVWELKSQEQCLAAGRRPSLVTSAGLWVDSVIEVKPQGATSAEIVWEWHLWDHLIQDSDPSKNNFGQISEHPELVDLNFSQNNLEDWNHVNSIDYHSGRDQIILSVHHFSEIWIIDHSTTMEESASHSGGKASKGGDLLYRWGNPRAYGRGTFSDQKLFVQHDAEWIPEGYPGSGNILVFNNGGRRPGGDYSSVDEIVLPLNLDGSYALQGEQAYGPNQAIWSYSALNQFSFYATHISSSQRLANGNTLICDGPAGHVFEVTPGFDTVWEYDVGSSVFRVTRYAFNLPEDQK